MQVWGGEWWADEFGGLHTQTRQLRAPGVASCSGQYIMTPIDGGGRWGGGRASYPLIVASVLVVRAYSAFPTTQDMQCRSIYQYYQHPCLSLPNSGLVMGITARIMSQGYGGLYRVGNCRWTPFTLMHHDHVSKCTRKA